MDVVIPLGNGSTWDDNELKYTLRSFEKYLQVDNVYVIGHRPKWSNRSLICITFQDLPGIENKEVNIYRKIMFACSLPQLSEDFIFANDDHFLMTKKGVGYYYDKTLKESVEDRNSHDHYYHALKNTLTVHPSGYNFDIHCPIVYNKQKFLSMPWNGTEHGYVIKSLYSNTYQTYFTRNRYSDLKITSRLTCAQLDKLTRDRLFFSVSDAAVNSDLKIFLNYLYPDKSRFEI